ncbi:unnamed protein product [Callosobruchus maculatus]|uniref:IRS-type PTB domain-containing protein n=1 Tax=Callosobruchus maculatus TaxID=64391 RepID=A0A653D7T2_CALMS|nr:unnamed protein product [Callosobruchus maculatus]
MFSFECGRRSPTGHGIYAFKCKKAEQLFNIVHRYITGNVPNEDPSAVDHVGNNIPPQPTARRPTITSRRQRVVVTFTLWRSSSYDTKNYTH